LKSIRRGVLTFLAVAFLLALRAQSQESAQPAPNQGSTATSAQQNAAPSVSSSFEISGEARSGKTPLPGATVTASNTLTGKKYSALTGTDGKFTFSGVPRGRYVVRIEFMGFAVFTKELVLNPENPSAKVDADCCSPLASSNKLAQRQGLSQGAASRVWH
jgi:trimeric autotransporter adhesin